MKDIGAIILAAGLGKRMKSSLIKILHPVCGQPMIDYVINILDELGVQKRVIVLGHQRERVASFLDNRNVEIAIQENPFGTGDAVKSAQGLFEGWSSSILILSGDTPLISKETIERLIEKHLSTNAAATILTVDTPNPTGYGRIIKDNEGYILRIVEEADAAPEERAITTINTGTYCFQGEALFSALEMVSPANAQGEYYLTDVFEILNSQGKKIASVSADSPLEVMGINSRKDLAAAETYLRSRILDDLMESGVTIISPEMVFIDKGVRIGQDTVIYPFTTILGQSVIGRDCIIGPHAHIVDSIIEGPTSLTGSDRSDKSDKSDPVRQVRQPD